MLPQAAPAPVAMSAPSKEPPFFRENWKKVLATNTDDNLKRIRVKDGVASITNGRILLRCPVQTHDGFYAINEFGALVPQEGPNWLDFPDVDAISPDFPRLLHTPPIPNAVIGQFTNFIEEVRRQDRTGHLSGDILLEASGACARHDGRFEFRLFPCQLPLPRRVVVNATHLKLAMVEMLRYDSVVIAHAQKTEDSQPIFVGRGWTQCAMIMPRATL